MRLIKQGGLLPLALSGIGRRSHTDGRVLDLFRNRAELKKAYSSAQSELQQWKDRLKQQEGAMARVQEALQALESRLTRPDTAYSTLVYYQLRELMAFGNRLLEQFVSELRAQREGLERESFRRESAADLQRRQSDLDASLSAAHTATAAAGMAVSQLRLLLRQQQAWWQYFKQRSLQHRLRTACAEAERTEAELNVTLARRDAIAAAAQPDFPGLSVGARRAINTAAIIYAHVLYERLASTAAFDAACKSAKLRAPPDDTYGDRVSCEQLIDEIQRALALLQQRVTLKEDMQMAALRLRPVLSYATEEDSVPAEQMLVGTAAQPGSRVLQDNAWQIQRLLLR